jgi:adenine deaminase
MSLPSGAEVRHAIDVAAGRAAGSLLLRGGRVVNVITNEIHQADVLLAGRLIAAVGAGVNANAAEVLDLGGAFVAPGLIDGHVHLESSLVTPSAYAEGVLPRGVTGVVCDPHEIANVAGEAGVRWLLAETEALPLDVWVTVPSCVPSTPFETVGSEFGLEAMERLAAHPRVVGVAELMSFPDVLAGDDEVLAKARMGETRALTVEGHAPGLTGADLHAYLASGVGSDHESTELEEGREKLRAGAFLMVREGSVTRNLDALLPLVDPRHGDRVGFVTDDRLPHDLLTEGGVDVLVRRAIAAGVNPAYAVRCASYNHARHYRLPRRGAVAPGYVADLLVLEDLEGFAPRLVFKEGVQVAERGALRAGVPAGAADAAPGPAPDPAVLATVRLGAFDVDALRIPATSGRVRCIVPIPNQILTAQTTVEPTRVDGEVVADPERDLLKLACVERHGVRGGAAVGLVRGFGLRRGALASSVGHDHHNVMVVGANDRDMVRAARRLEELGGGFVAVADGEVLAELPLELAGLITAAPLTEVRDRLDELDAAAARLGCTLPAPFMALSFLGLAVIPELRLTDVGLVDVLRATLVGLAADD